MRDTVGWVGGCVGRVGRGKFGICQNEDLMEFHVAVGLSHPRTRLGLEAKSDPGTWTRFTIYTFSNTIEINVA